MNWKLTSVTFELGKVIITGFRDNDDTLLSSTITKVTQNNPLNPNDVYDEGHLIVTVSDGIYIIDVGIIKNPEQVNNMKNMPYINADNSGLTLKNGDYYWGLPLGVYACWKGMINTDL